MADVTVRLDGDGTRRVVVLERTTPHGSTESLRFGTSFLDRSLRGRFVGFLMAAEAETEATKGT